MIRFLCRLFCKCECASTYAPMVLHTVGIPTRSFITFCAVYLRMKKAGKADNFRRYNPHVSKKLQQQIQAALTPTREQRAQGLKTHNYCVYGDGRITDMVGETIGYAGLI